MISNALERVIVRTMLGLLAERGITSIEEEHLVTALLGSELANDSCECRKAIISLKHAEIVQNGRGTKLNLSGTGLALAASVSLPVETLSDLRRAVETIFSLDPCYAQDASISLEKQ